MHTPPVAQDEHPLEHALEFLASEYLRMVIHHNYTGQSDEREACADQKRSHINQAKRGKKLDGLELKERKEKTV